MHQVDDGDYEVSVIGVIKAKNGTIIGTLVFDTFNRIRSIQLNIGPDTATEEFSYPCASNLPLR